MFHACFVLRELRTCWKFRSRGPEACYVLQRTQKKKTKPTRVRYFSFLNMPLQYFQNRRLGKVWQRETFWVWGHWSKRPQRTASLKLSLLWLGLSWISRRVKGWRGGPHVLVYVDIAIGMNGKAQEAFGLREKQRWIRKYVIYVSGYR